MSSYGTWRINKNSGYFLGGTAMKYVFVWDQLEAFPVDFMFWTLGVGNSGFYAWLKRPENPCYRENLEIVVRDQSFSQKKS